MKRRMLMTGVWLVWPLCFATPAAAAPWDTFKKALDDAAKGANTPNTQGRAPSDTETTKRPEADHRPDVSAQRQSESTKPGKTGRESKGGSSSGAGGCVNNTFRCAKTVEIGQRVEGFIDTAANRRQVFKVSVESPGRHRVIVYKEVTYPIVAFGIFDESQKEIYGQSFNARERNFDVIFNAPGVYYLSFYNSPGSGPTFAFDFTIQPLPASKF